MSDKKNIEFIRVERPGINLVKPVPANRNIPSWFKEISPLRSLFPGAKPDFTIKKCIPVLDALTTGYHLVTKSDIEFIKNENGSFSFNFFMHIDNQEKPISMHPYEQIRGFPTDNTYIEYAFKWSNPYVIKTPPGYSCLFTHPINQNLPFLTLTGQVDTDSHPLGVQFPFLMRNDFEGIIPKNTPIVQIIPYKRDDWEMRISNSPFIEDIKNSQQSGEEFEKTRYDKNRNPIGGEYKKKHRIKKNYL
jgi:hypothetical protein